VIGRFHRFAELPVALKEGLAMAEFELDEETPLACQLHGLDFIARKEAISRDLFAHAEEIAELPDGFSYRFSGSGEWLSKTAEFVLAERECCPFFTFEIRVERFDGPIWLSIRGSKAIKAFIGDELSGFLRFGAVESPA
jgi:hypothetical protein